MSHAARDRRPRLERAAFVVWALLVLGVLGRVAFDPNPEHNNVYLKVFAKAAHAFESQTDAYGAAEGGYRYPPACTVLLVPFELCGPRLGSVLWRLLNIAALLLGVFAVLRAGFPMALSRAERAVFWLVLAGTQIGSLNNGQANSLILGLLLLATLTQLRAHSVAPAAAIACSTVLKVYPLAYGLVLGVLRPRLLLWLIPLLTALLALPFALREPGYVWDQHVALAEKLLHEDRTNDLGNSYRNLPLLFHVVGVTIPSAVFLALQALGGLGIVALCLRLRAVGATPMRVLHYAFGLTMCHFMLLGPATELSTYALLGPTLAWGLLEAYRSLARWRRALWLAATSLTGLALIWVPRALQGRWPVLRTHLPLAALLVTIAMVIDGVREARGTDTIHGS
ncbi:MAG: glycosyltransferase 87 family protein [Planctomycetota bacterium]